MLLHTRSARRTRRKHLAGLWGKTGTAGLLLLWLVLPLRAGDQTQCFSCTTNNGAITITAFMCSDRVVTVPGTLNGLTVASIGPQAFSGLPRLASVIVADSVTNIGANAFDSCGNLTNVVLGTNVTSIGIWAFGYCSNLRGITLPSRLTRLGGSSFFGCTNLAAITIPVGVTNIASQTFWNCASLTSVTLPDRVTGIGDRAFAYCTGLTNITVPSGVPSLGNYAFIGCASLTAAYFKGNAPGLGALVFDGDNNATVYYLPGTTNWSATLGGRPTVLWNPQAQTADASFGVRTNRFGFTITGTSNLVIVVEACVNLASPAWSPVGTNTLTDGSSYFSDSAWTNYPRRVYRLRSP